MTLLQHMTQNTFRIRPSPSPKLLCPALRTYCSHNNDKNSISESEIGPPHPVSNVRPIRLVPCANESADERYYRERRESLQKRHHEFWLANNEEFAIQKKKFEQEKRKQKDGEQLTADEYAEFYADFFASHQQRHKDYNFYWWKENVSLLLPAFHAGRSRIMRQIFGKRG